MGRFEDVVKRELDKRMGPPQVFEKLRRVSETIRFARSNGVGVRRLIELLGEADVEVSVDLLKRFLVEECGERLKFKRTKKRKKET